MGSIRAVLLSVALPVALFASPASGAPEWRAHHHALATDDPAGFGSSTAVARADAAHAAMSVAASSSERFPGPAVARFGRTSGQASAWLRTEVGDVRPGAYRIRLIVDILERSADWDPQLSVPGLDRGSHAFLTLGASIDGCGDRGCDEAVNLSCWPDAGCDVPETFEMTRRVSIGRGEMPAVTLSLTAWTTAAGTSEAQAAARVRVRSLELLPAD